MGFSARFPHSDPNGRKVGGNHDIAPVFLAGPAWLPVEEHLKALGRISEHHTGLQEIAPCDLTSLGRHITLPRLDRDVVAAVEDVPGPSATLYSAYRLYLLVGGRLLQAIVVAIISGVR